MPADILLDRVCGLARDLHQAVEVVVAAVTEKGKASLAELSRPQDQGTPAERYLRAVQAAEEELDRIALAVAERLAEPSGK
jgi:hypothetical protein